MAHIDEVLPQLADLAEQREIPRDAEPGGALHAFVCEVCSFSPGQEFFIVFLLAAELADREARREGFADQFERAASRVNWPKPDPTMPYRFR